MRLIDDEFAAHSGWTAQNEPSWMRGIQSGFIFRRVDRQILLGVLLPRRLTHREHTKSKANQPDLTASTSGAEEEYHRCQKGKIIDHVYLPSRTIGKSENALSIT